MTVPRSEILKSDRWNIEALFPTAESWQQELAATTPLISEMDAFKGKLATNLKKALVTLFSIERRLRKLYTYAHLRHDEDTSDNESKNQYEMIVGLYHQFSQETSWLQPELLHMPEKELFALIKDPTLAEYHFFLEKLVRLKPHTLSTEQEELVALADQALDTAKNTFGAINNADFKFGTVLDGAGNEKPLTHALYGLYMRDRDRVLRKNAFQAQLGKYQSFENSLASLLSGQVQSHLFNARARKYSSCLEAALYTKNVDLEVYHALIKAVHSKIGELHRYLALRKKLLGLDELHFYDLHVPLVPSFEMKMSYDEAEELVIESVKPLGSEYVDLLRHGLKTGRWVDRYENQNKRSGAYSSGCYDSMPYILMNYKGILRDVFTLAHEVGHSMHSLYSRKNQPYHYADYTIFVAEVASTFNEELLTRTLVKRAKSTEEKAFLINEKIEDIRSTLFRQVMFAEFELFIHDAAEKRIPLTPQLLKEQFLKLNSFYFGNEVVLDPEIAIEWAKVPHFYYNFYVYQYATGISAALALCEKVVHGGQKEQTDYLNFLRSGSSDYPLNLLKSAGVDMRTAQPVLAAIDEFSSLVSQLEKLLMPQT
jgi:oligoendopeptidase F